MNCVRVSDIRQALDRVLGAVERDLGSEFALDADYYWHLPVTAAFNMEVEPSPGVLTTGSLVDDLDGRAGKDSNATWHELGHLIGVLRAVEHRCSP